MYSQYLQLAPLNVKYLKVEFIWLKNQGLEPSSKETIQVYMICFEKTGLEAGATFKTKAEITYLISKVQPKALAVIHFAYKLKVAFIQKILMHLSFSQTDKPYYFPELEF